MADTVSTNVIAPQNNLSLPTRQVVVQLLNVSDGSGENSVIKIAKANLLTSNRTVPSSITVESIEWFISGMRVDLYWDHSTDVKIATLANSGIIDFSREGGMHDTGTGGTGDITLSTSSPDSGDSYMIVLRLLLED